MATDATTVKVQTNIPIVLDRLIYCDYAESKTEGWSDQLKLTGKRGADTIRVYVPLVVGKDLTQHGYIEKTGHDDRFGHPAFRVTSSAPLRILRTEEGKKKITTVEPVDGQPAQAGSPTAAPQDAADPWVELAGVYRRALNDAKLAWEQETGHAPDDSTLHSAAATIFIEANRRGLKAS